MQQGMGNAYSAETFAKVQSIAHAMSKEISTERPVATLSENSIEHG
jgi:hypothetical protein